MHKQELPINSTSGESAGEVLAIAFNAIPMVGGVLSGIAGSIIAKRQNRRLNQFLVDIAEELHQFKDRVNADFVQTEEFQDLAEDVFSKAAECRQQETLDALRCIFLNTILSARPDYGEASEIAEIVNRWQPRHVILLRILANPVAADSEMGVVVGAGGGLATSIGQILQKLLPNWDDDQVDRTWGDLHDARIHRTSGTKTMMTDRGIHQLDGRLTDLGQKVAKYISEPT